MSKQFETVARWFDKLHYAETDDKTNNKTGDFVTHDSRAERMCKNVDTDDDCYFECSECGSATLVEYKSGGYGVPNYCPNCGRKVES